MIACIGQESSLGGWLEPGQVPIRREVDGLNRISRKRGRAGGFPGCWTSNVEPLTANAGTENDAGKHKIKNTCPDEPSQPALGDRASTVLSTVLPARRGREDSDRGGCASDGQAGHPGSSFGGQLSSTGVAHRCRGGSRWLEGGCLGEESRGKSVDTARGVHLAPRRATRQAARQSAGGGHAGLGTPGWCAKLQVVSRLDPSMDWIDNARPRSFARLDRGANSRLGPPGTDSSSSTRRQPAGQGVRFFHVQI